jgi:hypothetical protein
MTLKLGFLAMTLLICSCTYSEGANEVIIHNKIQGCFTVADQNLILSEQSALLDIVIGPKNKAQDCFCKSALFNYSAYQVVDSNRREFVKASFTTQDKKHVVLPVAVQKQLILNDLAIEVSISCSGV